MRSAGIALAGLILFAGAGGAQAQDWRAVSTSHHDVVFVDSASVRRDLDGRISFRARHRLAENDSNRDFGYDRIDVAVTGGCRPDGADRPTAGSVRRYFLRGRPIAPPDWREEDLAEDMAGLVDTVCRGLIGHRRFAGLDSAMAEYGEHDSLERLAAHVGREVELTGTVIQGFEMNAVSLCGSESGCSRDAPSEICWLEGNIHVAAPAGAPEWSEGGPRRDSAGAAFRGRIHRSRAGKGFGHVGAFACLVEVTGPARFVAVEKRPAEPPDHGAPGRRPDAVAAHAAFVETVRRAGEVGLESSGRPWTADDFSASATGAGACYSLPRFKGAELGFAAPVLGWPSVESTSREGERVILVTRHYEADLDFYLPDRAAAGRLEAFLAKPAKLGLAAVSQRKARVVLHYPDGRNESFRFDDPASAVQAAGMADRLVGQEIAGLERVDNRLLATPLRRISLIFPDEAVAEQARERAERLRRACAAD